MTDELSNLPKDLWKFAEKPYGGLFGNAKIVQVVREIVADPDREITPTELMEQLDMSYNSVNSSLNVLYGINFLLKDNRDPRRPLFTVNPHSKRLTALSLLALADLDDRLGSNTMNREVLDYCQRIGHSLQSGSSVGESFMLSNISSDGGIVEIQSISVVAGEK